MKIILAGIVCLFLGLSAAGQTENPDEAETVAPEVERISLQRDDGAGKAGEDTENFSTADKILHFRIELSALKPATVKMILVAAKVSGLKPETKSLVISYKTNGKQSIVNFKASPEDAWLAGKYRIDVFIDEKPAAQKEFEIQSLKKPDETEKPEESFLNPPPKPVRRKKKT